ncbi:ACT domain-containing protein [Roseicyclus persicicus]|uniref:ACT domain-containing protein n=1 Tax=Roseicyclus persicicus TaxID=2650661 RepID=A0A7X6JYM5_9RHOB|nr:ACT domain-containing protein [Roseibacterium persicicum]NKX44260.1 ACT domain-containing protein [Roseibacterium persicicum]
MPDIARSAAEMIGGMSPELMPETWVFASIPDPELAERLYPHSLASFAEAEGTSMILPVWAAEGLAMRQITLTVHSALDGVGLTAAVSGALAAAGIPCNMVAAFHHDHVFVPEAMAERALEVLHALQAGAQ